MTRTCDLRFRKPSLYPAELRDRSPAFCRRAPGISIAERARNRQSSEASAGAQSRLLAILLAGEHEALCGAFRYRASPVKDEMPPLEVGAWRRRIIERHRRRAAVIDVPVADRF